MFKHFDIIPSNHIFFHSMEFVGNNYRNVALLGRFGVDHRRRSGFVVSEAHSIPHLRNTTDLTQLVGDIYGFNSREKFLAYISGWFHDLVRSPSEDSKIKDDEASAHEALRILGEAERRGVIETSPEEQEAINFAITNHGKYPEWFNDPEKRNNPPEELRDKLWLALFVADKMEANGVRVIARRSSFVAGDRLKSEKGDWRQFGFEPDRDEGLVVAIESLLRLSFINPEGVYPEILQPLVHPLYEVQRDFVAGVCKALDLTVEKLAYLILDIKNEKRENILDVRKIEAPKVSHELARVIRERSGISDAIIESATDDQVHSAYETVMYFSEHYMNDLDKLVLNWFPQNEMSKAWKKEMIAYKSGIWLEDKKREFVLTRTLREHTPHDESLMPLIMGSPYRVPVYAYKKWNLKPIDEKKVVDLYQAEWARGTEAQLALVSQASEKAGLGDYPELLRKKTAEVVAEIIKHQPDGEVISILDVGTGPGISAQKIFEALPEALKPKTTLFLLDPSSSSLVVAKGLMEKNGINHQIIHDIDLNIGKYIKDGTIDIVTGVASIHHHSEIPFQIYDKVLKPGGFAIFADWHNSIWEYPVRVYEFLQRFDWSEKEKGLRNWLETYPSAVEKVAEPASHVDRKANEEITRFWLAYKIIVRQNGQLGPNAIWPLEGHRPVGEYLEGMRRAGFFMNSEQINRLIESGIIKANPDQLLPDSSLLMLTIGQKTK